MLVRTQSDHWVLLTQEHHAWVSGLVAAAWREPDGTPLRSTLVLATTLHDHAWSEIDTLPRLDAEHGAPVDFVDYPLADKLKFYAAGLDRLEGISPYLAHLVSRHYCAFGGTVNQTTFQAREAKRRARLEPLLVGSDADPNVQAQDLRLLQWLDLLSLYALLAAPDAETTMLPAWLDPTAAAPRLLLRPLRVAWRDATTLTLKPYPLVAPLTLALSGRVLARRRYATQAELTEAWAAAPPWQQTLTLAPG